MYPLNDKDLDRLSRDAAEHYDVESSASGWERLEMKLDKELPVKEKDRKRFLFWMFLIAGLAGGALVYMLVGSPINDNLASNKQEIGVDKTSPSTVREADGHTTTATENKQQDKTASPLAESNAVQPATDNTVSAQKAVDDAVASATEQKMVSPNNKPTQQNRSANTNQEKLSANKPVRENRVRGALTVQSKSNNGQLATNNKRSKKGNEPATQNSTAKNNTNTVTTDAAADKAVAQNDKQVEETKEAVTETPKMEVAAAETKTETKEEQKKEAAEKTNTAAAEKATAKKADAKKPSSSKWEFGLLAGPDFTNVEFTQGHKMGFNVGAIVGYRFSNRWLVNTGLIYTTKYYKAAGEYFNPPKHSWISYKDVEEVTGSCSMIEIPLNVRYDFSYKNKSRFFASAGVSSYIMDKQNYECTYYDNLGQLRMYPWKTDSNYNYFMSNINLSVGYERAIGRNFSVQAEPYLKLPVQGLGYGSMKMNSYGLYVTFKYKPGVTVKK